MATPMTPTQFLAQLRKWGVPYVEHDGWATHNRNAVGPWGPVEGVLLHHTGDDAPDAADLRVLWDGRSGLPGPLCQWGMDDEGTVHTVGWGRCNHAGLGAANVRVALLTENYGAYPPAPGPDAVDGNALLYGQETTYSGSAPPTSAAYRSTVRVFAAVCDFHGWSGRSCIGHKEWTARKVDPGHLDMAQFRSDVDALLEAGPSQPQTSTEEIDMRVAKVPDGRYFLLAGPISAYIKTSGELGDWCRITGQVDADGKPANIQTVAASTIAGTISIDTLALTQSLAAKAATSAAAALVAAGQRPDVDEQALAGDLAPLLVPVIEQHVDHFSDEELQAVATATADEQDKRARARLGS